MGQKFRGRKFQTSTGLILAPYKSQKFWNSTPPINFYLKVNYLILGWDLEKKGLGQLFY